MIVLTNQRGQEGRQINSVEGVRASFPGGAWLERAGYGLWERCARGGSRVEAPIPYAPSCNAGGEPGGLTSEVKSPARGRERPPNTDGLLDSADGRHESADGRPDRSDPAPGMGKPVWKPGNADSPRRHRFAETWRRVVVGRVRGACAPVTLPSGGSFPRFAACRALDCERLRLLHTISLEGLHPVIG